MKTPIVFIDAVVDKNYIFDWRLVAAFSKSSYISDIIFYNIIKI